MAHTETHDRLSPYEILLTLAGLLLFSSCLYVYVTDFPLGKYIFGPDFLTQQEPVGKLGVITTTTLRKSDTQPAFINIPTDTTLYNFDTIVTGADGSATVEFNDGSSIELGPRTMIRLVFEDRIGLAGISRNTMINVVAGQIKGQSRERKLIVKTKDKQVTITRDEPKPIVVAAIPRAELKPEPLKVAPPVEIPVIEILTPRQDEKLALEKDAKVLERRIDLTWKSVPVNTPVEVVFSQIADGTDANGQPIRRRIFSKTIRPTKESDLRVATRVKRPGRYEFELLPTSNVPFEKEARTAFTIDPDFLGIESRAPLVGGEATTSSRLTGDNILNEFDIQLRWKARPKTKEYQVSFFHKVGDEVPFLIRNTKGTALRIGKEKIFAGKLYYVVATDAGNGFRAISERTPFQFSFVPPVAVVPQPGEVLTKEKLANSNGEIVFTWERTNFTKKYEIEISRSKDFIRERSIRQTTEDNFAVVRSLNSGLYYWRIRSLADDLSSSYSEAQSFRIE